MPTTSPASATKGDLAASDYGGPGEEELTPAALQEIIIGDGSIGVVQSLQDSSFETDGFYSNPVPVILYNTYDLSYLDQYAIGIAAETYPYTADVLEDGNTTVDIYSSVSDYADPILEVEYVTNLDIESETEASTGADAGDGYEGNKLSATFNESEIIGLSERFGNPEGTDSQSIYNSAISAMALEVAQTFRNKSFVFKNQRTKVIQRHNYSSMGPMPAAPVTVTSSLETFSTSAAVAMESWGSPMGGSY